MFAQHDQEFHKEAHVVTGVETMPYSKEKQCAKLTIITVSQKFQSFVYIFGHPVVSLYVETIDVVLETLSIFKYKQFDV